MLQMHRFGWPECGMIPGSPSALGESFLWAIWAICMPTTQLEPNAKAHCLPAAIWLSMHCLFIRLAESDNPLKSCRRRSVESALNHEEGIDVGLNYFCLFHPMQASNGFAFHIYYPSKPQRHLYIASLWQSAPPPHQKALTRDWQSYVAVTAEYRIN